MNCQNSIGGIQHVRQPIPCMIKTLPIAGYNLNSVVVQERSQCCHKPNLGEPLSGTRPLYLAPRKKSGIGRRSCLLCLKTFLGCTDPAARIPDFRVGPPDGPMYLDTGHVDTNVSSGWKSPFDAFDEKGHRCRSSEFGKNSD